MCHDFGTFFCNHDAKWKEVAGPPHEGAVRLGASRGVAESDSWGGVRLMSGFPILILLLGF